ncbi:MAG: zinc ribbon domain-containing protein, partial [Betaproteobacteria bacterium]
MDSNNCKFCGHSNPAESEVCSECGSACDLVCRFCQHSNPASSNFCNKCGGQLNLL